MSEILDFYSEKEKLSLEAKRKALEEALSSQELEIFRAYCQKWKQDYAELARQEFTLIKSKGEII